MNVPLLLPIFAQQTVTPARSGAPLRVLAAVLLVLVLCGGIYAVRHLSGIEKEIESDDLVPKERGARNNMVLMVSALTFVAVCLLLFLFLKA